MGSLSHVQAGVVVSSLNPIDVGKCQKRDLACALDRQTIHSRQISAQRNSLFGADQRSLKTRIVEGLEKIIQRSRLKSPKRVLIVSGHEDEGGRQIFPQQFKHIKAIAFRHLYIEKDQVGAAFAYLRNRLGAGSTFVDDFNVWIKL